MENEHQNKTENYEFLESERAEKYFADVNIKLLSGKHIQPDDYNAYSFLEEFLLPLRAFYERLYKLTLVQDIHDQVTYFYLDFFSSGKGKLSDSSRHRPLTELQTVIGLMLLNMYYSRFFESSKTIYWADIKKEIEDSEYKEHYQRILFGESHRIDYTETEWQLVEKKFKNTINSFNELGWVDKTSTQQEELVFIIKPSIHRLAKLYEHELKNFDTFSASIIAKMDEE